MQNKDRWRVKVYELEEKGSWQDRGTGYVELRYVEILEGPAVLVIDEQSNGLVLQSRVLSEDVYEKQGETIVMWRELDEQGQISKDLALSFQEPNGCQFVWQSIQECQGQLVTQKESHSFVERERAGMALPECKLANLEQIRNIVGSVHPTQRNTLASLIIENDFAYFRSLLQLVSNCEDLDDDVHLKLLAQTVRCILFLNDSSLLQFVLEDRMFLEVAGCLEYDPELKQKADYREFLTKKAVFRQVVPMGDEELIEKIKQNFRLKYMKDNMLRPSLDESGVIALNSLQQFNNNEICNQLFADLDYLRSICECIMDPAGEQRGPAINFLRELFVLSKPYPPDRRVRWYDPLFEGINILLPAIMASLKDVRADPQERQMSAEILVAVLLVTPTHVRRAILEGPVPQPPPHIVSSTAVMPRLSAGTVAEVAQDNNECILFVLIRRLVEEDNTGVQEQIADCLRLLLDPERMNDPHKDSFLQLYFDYYIHWMITPFIEGYGYTLAQSSNRFKASLDDESKSLESTEFNPADSVVSTQGTIAAASSRRHICDILSLCVQCHGYRAKYFVLRNNAVTRVLQLLNSRLRHTHLAAIKFVRTIMETKDDFYFRHIVKHDLLRPLFIRLKECGSKDTMLTSAVIDLVEYIRAENIRAMVTYIVEKQADACLVVTQVDTFERLQLRYDQNNESDAALNHMHKDDEEGDGLQRRPSKDARRKIAEIEADEAYFEGGDDDEEHGNALSRLSRYGDEHDNDSDSGKSSPGSKVSLADDTGSVRRDRLDDVDRVEGFMSTEHKESFAPKRRRSNGIDCDNETQAHASSEQKGGEYDPLPPLRPKFENDEDAATEVFFRNKKLANGNGHSADIHSTSRSNHTGLAAGISFTMKKKPRLHNPV